MTPTFSWLVAGPAETWCSDIRCPCRGSCREDSPHPDGREYIVIEEQP